MSSVKMIQLDSVKRPSPSPSRSSIRSERSACRQPRVIQVNRDAATMVEAAPAPAPHTQDIRAPPGLLPAAPLHWAHTPNRNKSHLRSRTYSDGFIGNPSLELLLGVDCEACVALATERQCINKHISEQQFDLICNCDVQQNNFLNYSLDSRDRRPNTINIYDFDRVKRQVNRNHLAGVSHHSLDRRHMKSKTIGASYISKQFIGYEPTYNFVQKLKHKLSNLKKIGGDAFSKKTQAAVQLADIATASTGSLKKLSMLSLTNHAQKRVDSQNCIIPSTTEHQMRDKLKNSTFSGNVDQYFDGSKDRSLSFNRKIQKLSKFRSFDNSEMTIRNSPVEAIKFATLNKRNNQYKAMKRQTSYNNFPIERFGESLSMGSMSRGNTVESRSTETDIVDEVQTPVDADFTVISGPSYTHAHCTCDSQRCTRLSFSYDTQGKKRSVIAPDVTDRCRESSMPCNTCKPPHWLPTATTSTTSHSSTTTGNSSRMSDWHRRWCCVAVLVLVAGSACVAGPLALRAAPGAPLHERLRLAERLLHETPLIDGHNDLPWNIRKFLHNKIKDFRFDQDLRTISPWATSSWSHTDLPRLKQGRISAQFWAAYVPCDAQNRDAVQLTFEQIDLIQRLTDKYQPQLTLCTSAQDIMTAHTNHHMCSLIGVEGGHAIGGSLGILRTLYQVGVRYLTLTSTCNTPWAECASTSERAENSHSESGLTSFGKVVVKEMNRLGMLVDLSHVSERTMRDALAVSRAPVLFSHSSARALCNVTRNVPDAVLRLLAANKGLIMVNFYTSFLTCSETATVQDAIAHINHIRDVAGVDSVGLGAGYDGINYTPRGLDDVSSYPLLFAELMEEGWTIEELRKLAGLNLLRVMSAAEQVAKDLSAAHVLPYEEVPPRGPAIYNCSSQDL